MRALDEILRPFERFNDHVLPLCRAVAVLCIAGMVFCILLQVFCRYILNNALPWPDEAARFLMLWMTGMIAPSAYRAGGFVAIESAARALPRSAATLLTLSLLSLAALVLSTAVALGWSHVQSGWLFASSTLWVPLNWAGFNNVKIKLAWMYLSLFTGFALMLIVNTELMVRALIRLAGRGSDLRPLSDAERAEAR